MATRTVILLSLLVALVSGCLGFGAGWGVAEVMNLVFPDDCVMWLVPEDQGKLL